MILHWGILSFWRAINTPGLYCFYRKDTPFFQLFLFKPQHSSISENNEKRKANKKLGKCVRHLYTHEKGNAAGAVSRFPASVQNIARHVPDSPFV